MLHLFRNQLELATKSNSSVLGFLDAVHLPLVPYVVLKLGDQREDAQDEFASARGRVDGRIVRDLEASRSLTFRTSRRLWALASPSLTRMVFGAQLGLAV